MNIKQKRQLERLKYVQEYQSNQQHYDVETSLLIAFQIPFLELIEEQMKVNPNFLLKRLHKALNEWCNEVVYTNNNEEVTNQYVDVSNLGFELVELGRTKIKTEWNS